MSKISLHPELSHPIDLEFTDQELSDLEAAAEIAGLSVAEFIAAATLQAARARSFAPAPLV